MVIPKQLVQKIQYDYIDYKYKEGSFLVKSLDDSTIEILLNGLFSWAEENNLISDKKLDLSIFIQN